jgi:hypothetical protein
VRREASREALRVWLPGLVPRGWGQPVRYLP